MFWLQYSENGDFLLMPLMMVVDQEAALNSLHCNALQAKVAARELRKEVPVLLSC